VGFGEGTRKFFYAEIMHFLCSCGSYLSANSVSRCDATDDMLLRSGDIGVEVVKFLHFGVILRFSHIQLLLTKGIE